MNNPLGSISYRYVNTIIIILVCLLLFFALCNYEYLVPIISKLDLINRTSVSFLAILSFLTLIFSFIFFYEYKRNNVLLLNFKNKSSDYKNELEDLYLNLPQSVSHTFIFRALKEYSYILLKNGDFKNFENCLQLTKDIVGYVMRIKNLEHTVSWNEERHFLNKFLELVGFCFDTSKFKIELFEPTANYRFPLGLFFVPLFNAFEFAAKHKDSSIKVECFTVDGLWNCQISNYIMPLVRSKINYKYKGLTLIKKCILKGNWAIRLNRIQVEQGMIVVIVGKYIN